MIKYILFSFLFLLLCIPYVQQNLDFFTIKKLEGVELKTEKDTLNPETWMEGRFQKNKERSVNETIGMRDLLIRIYNQYNYSLFHLTESPGVVIGKSDYLYLTSYTDNFSGKNFIGWSAIEANVKRLKMLQEALKKKNTDLIVVFAPGKASFYPEYIPDEILHNATQNNYNAYKRLLVKEGLNFLDMQSWFNHLKGKTPYKLYPKYGVHWSYYGTYLAADTLKRYIEVLRKCELPDILVDKIEERDSLQQPDYDAGHLLNVFTVEKDTMPYPFLSFREKNGGKPKGLVISDSYAWQWYEQKILQNLFDEWSFWFYNNTMYPESFTKTKNTSDINYSEVLQKKDVIIVLASEGTLNLFPYGILDKTEGIYIPQTQEELISYYKLRISGDSTWLHAVIMKAIGKKITVEKALQEDAEWMAANAQAKK